MQVVSALLAGLGPRADLVLLITRFGQSIQRQVVHASLGLLIARLEAPLVEAGRHLGVRLIGQGVAGDVFHAQRDRAVQVACEIVQRLAGDREDEVEVDSADPRPAEVVHSTGDIGRVVPAFEHLEVGRVEGLSPDGHTGDPALCEHPGQLGGHRLGVGFDGELGDTLQQALAVQAGEQLHPQARPQQCGGAPAHENRVRPTHQPARAIHDFRDQSGGERLLAVPCGVAWVHDAVKIAVMAAVEAEGDVDVQPRHRAPGQRGHAGPDWSALKGVLYADKLAGCELHQPPFGTVFMMNVVLVMFKADGSRRDFPITKPKVVVGRKNDCDLRIPLTSVSRQHCEIEVTDRQIKVRDLGSSNGTYHNTTRVQEAAVSAGDEIVVGPVVFTVVVDGQPTDIKPVRTIVNREESQGSGLGGLGDLGASDSAMTLDDDDIEVPAEIEPEESTPTVDLDDPLAALQALSGGGDLELLDDDDDRPAFLDDSEELQIIDDDDQKR